MKRETSPLTALGRERLEAMRAAGEEILECRRVLLKGGLNVVGEMLPLEELAGLSASAITDPATERLRRKDYASTGTSLS